MPSGHAALGSGRAWERRSAILHGFVSTAAAERAHYAQKFVTVAARARNAVHRRFRDDRQTAFTVRGPIRPRVFRQRRVRQSSRPLPVGLPPAGNGPTATAFVRAPLFGFLYRPARLALQPHESAAGIGKGLRPRRRRGEFSGSAAIGEIEGERNAPVSARFLLRLPARAGGGAGAPPDCPLAAGRFALFRWTVRRWR